MRQRQTLLLLAALATFLFTAPAFGAINQQGCLDYTFTPPISCAYVGVAEYHSGDPNIDLSDPRHRNFTGVVVDPGGIFEGTIDRFQSELDITVRGVNELEGYERTITLNLDCEAHAGPYDKGEPFISFPTEMMRVEGGLQGDPDFEMLHLVGGTENGFPSPGHLTAVDQGDGTYAIDSTFQMSFQVEYVGAPGGALEGFAGVMEGIATVTAVANDFNCK